jgi:hypothetical protein
MVVNGDAEDCETVLLVVDDRLDEVEERADIRGNRMLKCGVVVEKTVVDTK